MICTAIVIYFLLYGWLRKEHHLIHNSNAEHWDAAKVSPGHYIRPLHHSVGMEIVAYLFKPLSLLEEWYQSCLDIKR
jgi:hypothetical protein